MMRQSQGIGNRHHEQNEATLDAPKTPQKSSEPLNRRQIVTQGTGYALAMCPVSAMALTTPSDGIVTDWLSLKAGGQETMQVYRAVPKSGPPKAVVFVIQEIFGLHEYIKDVCRRLATKGYVALAPDLFFRQGDATKLASIDDIRTKIVAKVSQKAVLGDLDRLFEEASKTYPTLPVGITGFCWGGTVTWLYAAHNPKIKAGVAWYGRLKFDKTPLISTFPLEIAPHLKAPVLGLYGGLDKGIPLGDVKEMSDKLASVKSASSIKVFPKADHGFHADYRPSYAQADAKQGWEDMLAWFGKHGVP